MSVVVADRRLGLGAEAEFRLLGDDVDDAGRGALAEQGALRTLQDLDALHLAQVAERDAVARAIDAVDHDADRAFQAGVVADRADAADAGGGRGFRRGRGHGQAGGQDRQILDVLDARVLQQLGADRGDHHRHVLQVLLALLGGDDDRVDGLGFGILGLSRQRGQTGEHDGGRRAAKHLSKAHFLPRFVL